MKLELGMPVNDIEVAVSVEVLDKHMLGYLYGGEVDRWELRKEDNEYVVVAMRRDFEFEVLKFSVSADWVHVDRKFAKKIISKTIEELRTDWWVDFMNTVRWVRAWRGKPEGLGWDATLALTVVLPWFLTFIIAGWKLTSDGSAVIVGGILGLLLGFFMALWVETKAIDHWLWLYP